MIIKITSVIMIIGVIIAYFTKDDRLMMFLGIIAIYNMCHIIILKIEGE
jgi:hypothetical protein